MQTTKKDHEVRAMEIISKTIVEPIKTATWKADDLKTKWLQRAKHLGIDGYSAHLRYAFIKEAK